MFSVYASVMLMIWSLLMKLSYISPWFRTFSTNVLDTFFMFLAVNLFFASLIVLEKQILKKLDAYIISGLGYLHYTRV